MTNGENLGEIMWQENAASKTRAWHNRRCTFKICEIMYKYCTLHLGLYTVLEEGCALYMTYKGGCTLYMREAAHRT